MNFQDALGGHSDPAALKFILNLILKDARWDELIRLLTANSDLAAIVGDPGWELERRPADGYGKAWSNWPASADYRAFVDSEENSFAPPEGFYEASVFHSYVESALQAYVAKHPERSDLMDRIRPLLS